MLFIIRGLYCRQAVLSKPQRRGVLSSKALRRVSVATKEAVSGIAVIDSEAIAGLGTSAPAGRWQPVSRSADRVRGFGSIRSSSSIGAFGGDPGDDVQTSLAAHGARIAVERDRIIDRFAVRGFGRYGLEGLADLR